MKITGTNSYMSVEYNGKTARFEGELLIDGFCAYENSVRWLSPHDNEPVTTKEKEEIIAAVLKEVANKDVKIYFE